MTAFGSLPVNIGAASGSNPQVVTPKGWGLSGVLCVPNAQVYAASMTPDLALGNWITITVTNGVAFTVQNPTFNGAALAATNVPVGSFVALTILNASGGGTGAITLGSAWKGAAGFGNPANNQYVSALFMVFSATQLLALSNWSTSAAF